jgi:hypothetical protein
MHREQRARATLFISSGRLLARAYFAPAPKARTGIMQAVIWLSYNRRMTIYAFIKNQRPAMEEHLARHPGIPFTIYDGSGENDFLACDAPPDLAPWLRLHSHAVVE